MVQHLTTAFPQLQKNAFQNIQRIAVMSALAVAAAFGCTGSEEDAHFNWHNDVRKVARTSHLVRSDPGWLPGEVGTNVS